MNIGRTKVQLYVLDTGLIESSDFAIWSPSAKPGTSGEMTVRSYLIVHPDGVLLWDTGIADEIAARQAGERIADTIVFRVPATLRSQLEAIGLDPIGVDLIGLSHLAYRSCRQPRPVSGRPGRDAAG